MTIFVAHLIIPAAAAAKSLQSCPTLCDPIDGSSPGSLVSGILQARTLEWVAIAFSNAWKWKVKVKPLSHVRPSATPWTAAFQAPLSMGFSRQEYWSGGAIAFSETSLTPINLKDTKILLLWVCCWVIDTAIPSFIVPGQHIHQLTQSEHDWEIHGFSFIVSNQENYLISS